MIAFQNLSEHYWELWQPLHCGKGDVVNMPYVSEHRRPTITNRTSLSAKLLFCLGWAIAGTTTAPAQNSWTLKLSKNH